MPLQFASLNDGQVVFVWSDCLLDLGTDFLVGNVVNETSLSHLISSHLISSHLIYSLTARVVGAPQMISQPVSSIYPCSPLLSGT